MGLFGSTKRILGLDIGSSAIKAVEMALRGDELTIVGYGKVVLADPESDRADAITRLLKSHNLRTRRSCTSVSGRSVIVRYVTMGQMSDENLANAIKFEADKYIPFDIDEVVLDCQRLPVGQLEDEEMKVVLVAVKRQLVLQHVELLRGAGLDPRVIDVDSFALGNAFELHERCSPQLPHGERIVALVDIGASKTNINIIMDGTSLFTREVYLGGNDFTDAIARELELSFEDAEARKREPAAEAGFANAIGPVVDDLGNEIHLSLDFFENQYDRGIDEIYLSGGGCKLDGLVDEFVRIFGRPTVLWDPTEYIGVAQDSVDLEYIKQDASQLAVALGLASRLQDQR